MCSQILDRLIRIGGINEISDSNRYDSSCGEDAGLDLTYEVGLKMYANMRKYYWDFMQTAQNEL